MKANTITLPGNFDPRNPAALLASLPSNGTDTFSVSRNGQRIIGPTLTADVNELATGPALDWIEYPYTLVVETDTVALAAGPALDFAWVTVVSPPAAQILTMPAAPTISTGARVVVPAAGVAVSAVAPTISRGAMVTTPVAGVAVNAVAPEYAGRQRTVVNVPAAQVITTAQALQIITGTAVLVPVAGIVVTAQAPEEVGKEKANWFSSFGIQVTSWETLINPDIGPES